MPAGPEGFQFFDPADPEDLKRAQDMMEMNIVSAREQGYRILESFDAEQLMFLESLLNQMSFMSASADSARMQAGYWIGFIAAERNRRFNICPACRGNHDEQLEPEGNDS